MKHTNITDELFWDQKYSQKKKIYSLWDPLYGAKGLLFKTLKPWTVKANNILELGCGSSRFLMFFNLVLKLKTFGIDFSNEGLYILKKMSNDHEISHTLYSGDMFEHDVGDHKFDIVFHSGLVEHFRDLKTFFYRCRFFCSNKGLMIFFMPNMQNKAWSWHSSLCPENFNSHIPYTKEQILEALEPHFSLLSVKSWGYPQIYAGGPPENIFAKMVKYINFLIILFISLFVFGYKGNISKTWSSSWLFICKPKGL